MIPLLCDSLAQRPRNIWKVYFILKLSYFESLTTIVQLYKSQYMYICTEGAIT